MCRSRDNLGSGRVIQNARTALHKYMSTKKLFRITHSEFEQPKDSGEHILLTFYPVFEDEKSDKTRSGKKLYKNHEIIIIATNIVWEQSKFSR